MVLCKVLPLGANLGELTYSVPDSLKVELGYKVIVPLGTRLIEGVVVGLDAATPDFEVKEILSVATNYSLLNDDTLTTALLSDAYAFVPIGTHLSNLLWIPPSPKSVKKVKSTGKLANLTPAESELFSEIETEPDGVTLTKLSRMFGKKRLTYALKRLREKGVVEVFEEITDTRVKPQTVYEVTGDTNEYPELLRLSEIAQICETKAALSRLSGISLGKINKFIQSGDLVEVEHKPAVAADNFTPPGFLTNSFSNLGFEQRLEKYTEIAISAREEGHSVVILAPDVSMCQKIYSRLSEGNSNVYICVGGMSPKESSRLAQAIKDSAAAVCVGLTSVLFLPLKNLHSVIVDEPLSPRFDVSTSHTLCPTLIAKIRAKTSDCNYIEYGTPATIASVDSGTIFESWKKRVEVVNMTFEPGSFEQPLVSAALTTAIGKEIEAKRSVLVFLNRRGYSSFVVCADCGEILKCPTCHIPLTYTRGDHTVRCRYCGYNSIAPDVCPECQGLSVRFKAGGVERVEIELTKRLPGALILRADSDTKESAKNIRHFGETPQVLIGTSMVFGRIDLSTIKLVCVASVDSLLSMPVYSSAYKAYSEVSILLSMMNPDGKLMLQSYLPQHPFIKAASTDKLSEFVAEEIEARKEAKYPPFVDMLIWHVKSREQARANDDAVFVTEKLIGILGEEQVTPPNKGYFHRLKGEYRWDILTKTANLETRLGELYELFRKFQDNGINVEVTNPNR